MTRTAIFGSRGYLGGQLAYYIRQHGGECAEFDLPQCDVTQTSFWRSFEPDSFSGIFFFAGLTGTEQGFAKSEDYVRINEIGLLHLLDCLAPLGTRAPKIVFPSSRLVYKGGDNALDEEDEKDAKTVYAVNKLACERYLSAYSNRFGIAYAVLRLCVPYGNLIASDYSYGTIGFFLRQAEQGKVVLYGDGLQRRTFTHVADFCEIACRMMDAPAQGVFNVGGTHLSLLEAARIIARIKNAEIAHVPWPDVAFKLESGSTVFDSTRLDRALRFDHYRDFDAEMGGI